MTPQTQEWAAQYEAGKSLRTIATQSGVTHKTVRAHLHAAGIPTRSRNQTPPPSRLGWDIDYCPNCDQERRMNPTTGWCSSCTLRSRNHPNLSTPFGTM